MNDIVTVIVSAGLILFPAYADKAIARPPDNTPARSQLIVEIDSSCASVESLADRIATTDPRYRDSQSLIEEMNTLRENVNRIGRDLQTLGAEHESLPAGDVNAIDGVTPQLQQMAASVESSIRLFNSDRTHLWATPYQDDIVSVYADAQTVRRQLDVYLKLASVRRQEERLEGQVDTYSGAR